ncbi:MAG: glycosyltransferase family 2 protein [Anaerolineae bacterium]
MDAETIAQSRPDLSVIVLSWNVRELLRACLQSVSRSQEARVRGQGPGVRSQESGARSQEPGVRSQGSGARDQESGVRSQEPGDYDLTTDHCPLPTDHRPLPTDYRPLATVPCPPTTEIIVVDNASTDGSAEMVAAEFPAVRLIRNATNVGYARGNNIGIAASTGRYVLLLNSDTVVPPGALEALVAFMDAHPQAAACSPRLLQPNGTPQPYAFGCDPTPGYLLRRGLARALFRRPLHNWAVAEPIRADWVSGACLLVRRAAIEQVGGLDEAMFMYFEDNDWCRRMRLAGWQVWYVPTVAITHIGGAGLKQNPAARQAYYRSLAYFYRKHYGPLAQAFLLPALAAYRLATKLGH